MEVVGEVSVRVSGDLSELKKDLAEAERLTREFDRAASTSGSAQSKLSGSFAGTEASIAKLASGVDAANAALARLEKAVLASSASTAKLDAAKQTAAKTTIQEARASEGATAAMRQEAVATDRLTASINRQAAATAASARARAAAGLDAWGRTPAEVASHVAATRSKASPVAPVAAIPVSANTQAELTKAQALTRTASEGARATGMLAAGLTSVLIPASMIQFAIFSLASATTEWATSMLSGANKTEKVLERHRDLINEIAASFPAAAEAARKYEEEAGRLPQVVLQAHTKQQQDQEREDFNATWSRLTAAARNLSTQLDPMGQQKTLPGYESFSDIADQMERGTINAEHLQKRVAEISLDPNLRRDVRATAYEFQKLVDEAAAAAARIGGTNAASDRLHSGRFAGFNEVDDRSAYLDQRNADLYRLRRQRDAALAQISARSPEERRQAAMASAAAKPSDKDDAVRQFEIATAGATAYTQSLRQVTDAQDARIRSMNQGLEQQKLEVSLISMTTPAAASRCFTHSGLNAIARDRVK